MNFAQKLELISRLTRDSGTRTFVETGTYEGRMTRAMASQADRILTCELEPTLARLAREAFASQPHITVFQGDSGELLPGMLERVDPDDSLVWLDAHYSGGKTAHGPDDSPIARELAAVCKYLPCIVVIDDRRCCGTNGWPTEGEISQQLSKAGYVVQPVSDTIVAQRTKNRGVI